VIFTDTFDRADNLSSLGSPWTTHAGQFGVVSSDGRYTGELYYLQKAGWASIVPVAATVDVESSDMAVEWDAGLVSGHHWRVFRFASTNSTLLIGADSSAPNDIFLMERTGPGFDSPIGAGFSPGWQSKRVRVEALGSSISVYVDGVLTLSGTSSYNSSATRAGIGGNAIGWQPTGAFTDTFGRADSSSLGSPWVVGAGTWGIESSRAKYVSGVGIGAATVDLGSPIQNCEWEWTALAKGPSYNIFRYSDPSNFYLVSGTGANPSTVYLFRQSAGSSTVLATATGVTWGPGATLRVEAGESSIKVWTGSTLVFDYSTPVDIYGSAAGIGGNMSDPLMVNTRWSRFYGNGVDTDSSLQSGGSTGPWLNDFHWTRFHSSPWPVPTTPGGGFRRGKMGLG